MSLVRVTGTDFIRDTESMGLCNINSIEKEEYYNKVKLIHTQKTEINMLKTEISDIRSDINDIKTLMIQIINKG